MAEAEEMFQKGNKLYEQGYMLQANYYYGQAVVAVASLRYGLSELIYVKQRDERAAAKKAAEEKAARQAEEQRKAAARHIEAQTFSVDLPEFGMAG